jgi:hypothetical protein
MLTARSSLLLSSPHSRRHASRHGLSVKSTERRVASIQHGDYVEALRIIGRGEVEPYFGMAYTLGVLRRLFADSAHLVVCLNSPAYRERQGRGGA